MQKHPSKKTANAGPGRVQALQKSPPRKAQASKKTVSETPEVDETPPKLPETDGWLTRNETSDMLRCSLQTLKNYETRGLLHPRHALRRDRTGADRVMLVYDPKELTKLPSKKPGGPSEFVREPGELAARAFEMFRHGCLLDEVVIELRETPERIDYLHERWLDHTKARYVITPEAKKVFEQLVGPFTGVTELLGLFEEKLAPA